MAALACCARQAGFYHKADIVVTASALLKQRMKLKSGLETLTRESPRESIGWEGG